MALGNGKDAFPAPSTDAPGESPLPEEVSVEIRKGVGRLATGASELMVIALVMPLFLVGIELAAEGFSAGGFVERGEAQRPWDRGLFTAYAACMFALAGRAKRAAAAAIRLLPSLLSADPAERTTACVRLQVLGGPPAVRHAEAVVARRGCAFILALAAVATLAWILLPFPLPNPLWLTIFVSTLIAMDLRWRELMAGVVAPPQKQ